MRRVCARVTLESRMAASSRVCRSRMSIPFRFSAGTMLLPQYSSLPCMVPEVPRRSAQQWARQRRRWRRRRQTDRDQWWTGRSGRLAGCSARYRRYKRVPAASTKSCSCGASRTRPAPPVKRGVSRCQLQFDHPRPQTEYVIRPPPPPPQAQGDGGRARRTRSMFSGQSSRHWARVNSGRTEVWYVSGQP